MERPAREVEGTPQLVGEDLVDSMLPLTLRQVAEILDGDDRERLVHRLSRPISSCLEPRSQHVVTLDHEADRPHESIAVERAFDPSAGALVVDTGSRGDGLVEPEPLLSERKRSRGGVVAERDRRWRHGCGVAAEARCKGFALVGMEARATRFEIPLFHRSSVPS
jgi:hypothetical protein